MFFAACSAALRRLNVRCFVRHARAGGCRRGFPWKPASRTQCNTGMAAASLRHATTPKALTDALWEAVGNRRADVAATLLLVDGRADLTADCTRALTLAAWNGDVATVQALLADGRADPAADCSGGLTLAARRGQIAVVQALLADGRANPAADHSYALWIAARNGHTAVVCALLTDGRVDHAEVVDAGTPACRPLAVHARWVRRRRWCRAGADGNPVQAGGATPACTPPNQP
jgi:hypothetical protein